LIENELQTTPTSGLVANHRSGDHAHLAVIGSKSHAHIRVRVSCHVTSSSRASDRYFKNSKSANDIAPCGPREL